MDTISIIESAMNSIFVVDCRSSAVQLQWLLLQQQYGWELLIRVRRARTNSVKKKSESFPD